MKLFLVIVFIVLAIGFVLIKGSRLCGKIMLEQNEKNKKDLERLNYLKPKQEMKKEIKLKKGHVNTFLFEKGCNVKSLEIDEKRKTVSIDWHEEEKPALKTGEWYTLEGLNVYWLVLDSKLHHCGFKYGVWEREDKYSTLSLHKRFNWKLSNMQEVKKLLIKEAEKRIKIGCVINNGIVSDRVIDNLDFYFIRDCEKLAVKCNGLQTVLFDCNTGKWAEIVKEPLYINCYGRKYYKGDEYNYLISGSNGKLCSGEFYFDTDNFYSNGSLIAKFIGTKKECYQYLADNCKE